MEKHAVDRLRRSFDEAERALERWIHVRAAAKRGGAKAPEVEVNHEGRMERFIIPLSALVSWARADLEAAIGRVRENGGTMEDPKEKV